ncbi:MetQ/NlpA family ABC transporter substrate-binding protein [Dermacoccus barathri]|uniref:MetQ/NlpA family ABC transporter substrate-binding protein n=1 Tax=Dermacoccus barathri TaxID=322601 RepID=UPI00187A07AB|nr:MetQ/NlpA family ABC transporter substrate-binding protein [Dermacoccus barathri]MBE7370733.1 methionine ABC transporter substrate-binding protein [Dermacoccus barathri]
MSENEKSTPTTSTDTPAIPALPEKPKSNGGKYAAFGAGALVVALAAGFGIKAFTGSDDEKLTKITVGTTEASDPYWNELIKVGKEKYGLEIEPVNFTDYTQANPALSQGQVDLNQFQHLQFLADYNAAKNDTLTPVGSTYIVPLSLYSKKHSKINEFAKGGKVAIPNDATNQARALLLLQSAGLLTLKGGGNSLSTPADIDAGKSKVKVAPVEAAQTAAALPSVEGAVVNNNFAADANLDPSKALFKDDPKAKSSEPYINVIAARKKDADNPAYAKFVQAYHEKSVQDLIAKRTKGTQFEVKRSVTDVRGILARLESQIKAAK